VSTEVAIALIGVGGTLGATVATFGGTALLQRMKSRREDQAERNQLLNEVLVAATSLTAGVQIYRSGWIEGPSLVERVFKPPRSALAAMDTVVMPRFERLGKATIAISMWSGNKDRAIKDAAIDLAEAAGALVDAMTEKAVIYEARKEAFGQAVGEVRRAIDGRKAREQSTVEEAAAPALTG
jgi:hypothetical protein